MIKHCWSILCQNIITDAETNVASYIIAIDSVMASDLPVKIPFLAIGTSWARDTGNDVVEEYAIRIVHVSPRGQATTLAETGALAVQSQRHRMNFVLNGFVFNEPGVHKFHIVAKINGVWADASSLPVWVVVNKPLNAANTLNTLRQ